MVHHSWRYTRRVIEVSEYSLSSPILKFAGYYAIGFETGTGKVNHCSAQHMAHTREECQRKPIRQIGIQVLFNARSRPHLLINLEEISASEAITPPACSQV